MNKLVRRVVPDCRWLAILSVLVAALAPVVFGAGPEARKRGVFAFQTKGCLRCHSITGVGGTRAPDLGSVGLRRSANRIRGQIVHGGHGMPPFGGVLTGREVSDLVEFLSSCRTDVAPGCRDWQASAPN